MNKPLYVTDLDGTLMRTDKSISPRSVNIINRLIREGVCFTVATARTIRSAAYIVRDIRFTLPVITLNGTALANAETGKITGAALFSDEDTVELKRLLHGRCANTVVKALFGDEIRRTYLRTSHNEAFSAYYEEHQSDPLMSAVDTEEELFAGGVCFLSLIAPMQTLEPVWREIAPSGRWEALLQKDTYREDYWLEIFPKGASKAEAMRKVMKQAGCDGLVVFGDSVNDLSGFRIADECYAVANASEDLKAAATAVIGSNDSDAVAEWLDHHAIKPRSVFSHLRHV